MSLYLGDAILCTRMSCSPVDHEVCKDLVNSLCVRRILLNFPLNSEQLNLSSQMLYDKMQGTR